MGSFTHCSANEAIQMQNHEDITLPLAKRKEKDGRQPAETKKAVQSGKETSASKTEEKGKDDKATRDSTVSIVSELQNANLTEIKPGHVSANNMQTIIHKTQQIAKNTNKLLKPERGESASSAERAVLPSSNDLSSSVTHNRTAGINKNLTALVEDNRIEESYFVVNKGQLRLPRVAKVSDDTLRNCRVISCTLFIGLLVNVSLILSVCFIFFLVVKYSFFRTCYIHIIKLIKMGNRLVTGSTHESSDSKIPGLSGAGSAQPQTEESSTLGNAANVFDTGEDCNHVGNSLFNLTFLERIHY